MIGSFIAVELLNLPGFFEYLKYASLDKVATIKDTSILLGIELPAIISQLLTLKSYKKEVQEDELEKVIEQTKQENEIDPIVRLQEISEEKETLQNDLDILEKMKIMKEKLFDPEYYSENKDAPIRKLTKELFKK